MVELVKVQYLLLKPILGSEQPDALNVNLEIDAAPGNEHDLLIDGDFFLLLN